MSIFSKDLIRQEPALIYVDDYLLMSTFNALMLQLIKQLPDFAKEKNLQLAPVEYFFTDFAVKYLGHERGLHTIKPIQSKKPATRNFFSLTSQFELMRFIGSMNIYSELIDKLLVHIRPL